MRQEDLEAASGVAQGDISKYEKNKATPTIPSLLKLAKGLKRPVGDLLVGIDVDYDELLRDLLRHNDRGSSSAAHSQPQQQGDFDVRGAEDSSRRLALAKELDDLAETLSGALQDVARRLARDVAS